MRNFNDKSDERKKEFLNYKLSQLNEAFGDIIGAWLEDNTTLANDILEEDYPFASCMFELSAEVSAWVEQAQERIKEHKS